MASATLHLTYISIKHYSIIAKQEEERKQIQKIRDMKVNEIELRETITFIK